MSFSYLFSSTRKPFASFWTPSVTKDIVVNTINPIQTRGAKYAKPLKQLPGFMLPHQKKKGSILKNMIRARLRKKLLATPNPYPRKPHYGSDRSILSKLFL